MHFNRQFLLGTILGLVLSSQVLASISGLNSPSSHIPLVVFDKKEPEVKQPAKTEGKTDESQTPGAAPATAAPATTAAATTGTAPTTTTATTGTAAEEKAKQDAAVKSHVVPSPINQNNFQLNTFRPIDPMATFTYTTLKEIKEGKPVYESLKFPDPTKENNDAINELLPNFSALVATYKRETSGGLTYTVASVSAAKTSYKVILDYVKYREEPILDANNDYICQGRVGVGIRMIAEVVTKKANINLGSLAAIGFAAKNDDLAGTLYVDVIGLSSKEINSLVPMSSVIDETSIQTALQALASIKSKIFDAETKLAPHILAVNLEEKKKCEKPTCCRETPPYCKEKPPCCKEK